MADDRFKMSRNVLATDKVPDMIFGIPIVSRRGDYTEDDIAFFREYPEAGGYYDMGDGDDTVRGAIGGGDSVPDAVREFYRDPLTGNENVPDSVKRDWEVYRTMHPDAAGYSWNSVKGFSIAKDIDPGFAQVPKAKDIDPGFTRPPKEKPTWYEHKDYVPGTGKNKYGESVVGYPESEYEYTRRNNPTRIDPKDIKGTGVSFTDADRVRVPKERMEEYGKWLDGIAALDPTMKTQTLVPPDWRTNPKWKEFQRDYDYGAAFMAGAKVPTAKAPDGRYHLSDAGKLPTHPTFSRESYYARDPRWSGLAGGWTEAGNYVPGVLESHRRALQAPPIGVRELWSRAVRSTGDLDGMSRVFAAISGESSLDQRGATAGQISNGHLARLIVHANETDRYNGNPANHGRRTVLDTVNRTSHVLSKYAWGTGPGANWFDAAKKEPRFDLIDASPVASRTARDLIMNAARFLHGGLRGRDWLPSDAISYGDGPNGLTSDREEIKPAENLIGPMPRGFRIGRKKGAK